MPPAVPWGRSVTGCHAGSAAVVVDAAEVPAVVLGVSSGPAPVAARLRGAPLAAVVVPALTFCSPRVTVAGALPLSRSRTVMSLFVPQGTVTPMAEGLTSSFAGLSRKSAVVTASARTFTARVCAG